MEVYINDLSLFGQYIDRTAFREVLSPLISLRIRNPHVAAKLYCSKLLSGRPATRNESLQQAIVNTRDHDYIRLVLNWLAKSGPFWDDDRFSNRDDYFTYEGSDVTDQGLGETARRTLAYLEVAAYSFWDEGSRFLHTPLNVTHGLDEEPLGTVQIVNIWDVKSLEALVEPPCNTWAEFMAASARRFPDLIFAPYILDPLKKMPFNVAVTNRVTQILNVLQGITEETSEEGSLSEDGLKLWQKHSVGEKAWITDEFVNNKREFRSDLTFRDPTDLNRKVFCPWHGKIKVEQYRVHFEWPRPAHQRTIKIVYIGPKITKT